MISDLHAVQRASAKALLSQWCDGCGRVVHVDDWRGDGDECDGCVGEA